MAAADIEGWESSGFFIRRGLLSASDVAEIEEEAIRFIRADPPDRHPQEGPYETETDLLIYPEKAPGPVTGGPEDLVAKVFNSHAVGAARRLSADPRLTDPLVDLLGPDIDCFQSQFILKNPGVIGQPWHQDAFYFRYDREPQVTVWVALSAATLENGCLWVVPGSHRENRVFDHVPDQRPESLQGYLEIVSEGTGSAEPVLMEPGDVLFFHSFLMHRSTDNIAPVRRAAMVYHYAQQGTRPIDARAASSLARVNRWLPARRATASQIA